MRRQLNVYVANEILSKDEVQPSPSNCQFCRLQVTYKVTSTLLQLEIVFLKLISKNISEKINQWSSSNPEDFFFFRPYGEVSSGSSEEEGNPEEAATNTLLFVHQTMWQRRLLQRYGNHMCLLDATYKTARYALPLFFLVVQTNVDYQVVGSFVIQHETSQCIKEALQIPIAM